MRFPQGINAAGTEAVASSCVAVEALGTARQAR